jgi:hypothetical protein
MSAALVPLMHPAHTAVGRPESSYRCINYTDVNGSTWFLKSIYTRITRHMHRPQPLNDHKYEVVGLLPTTHRLSPRKICGHAGLIYTLTEGMTITSYWKQDSMLLHVTTQPGMCRLHDLVHT